MKMKCPAGAHLLQYAVLVGLVLWLIDYATGATKGSNWDPLGPLSALYCLFIVNPAYGVCVRRLHDTGRSGNWISLLVLFFLAPTLIIFLMSDSDVVILPHHNSSTAFCSFTSLTSM